jgi:hypothetical protein
MSSSSSPLVCDVCDRFVSGLYTSKRIGYQRHAMQSPPPPTPRRVPGMTYANYTYVCPKETVEEYKLCLECVCICPSCDSRFAWCDRLIFKLHAADCSMKVFIQGK